jgi:phosphoglycerate dehydrogenase-like enzyme
MDNDKKTILGVIYKTANTFWNIDYLLLTLKEFENSLLVKLIDITEYNKDNLPTDLDIVTLGPSHHGVLPEIINLNKNLKWVHTISAGVDKFLALKEIKDNDKIVLTNSKGAYADNLAEFAVFSMLYFSFNAPVFVQAFIEKKWISPVSSTLKGKTLSVIGFGENGIAIAKRAKLGFEMNVIGVKKDISNVKGKEYLDKVLGLDDLDTVLECSDFVLNYLPHTKETVNLFTYEKFCKMKKTAVFINLGRGTSVVEEGLIRALREKIIKAASLDVFYTEPLSPESGLYELDNVFISCHAADQTSDFFKDSFDLLVQNLRAYLNGETLITAVDKNKGY